jgi:hypothetical protein
VVGLDASPIGCSLPLGVVWGFVTQLGGVVSHIVVGLLGSRWYWGTWSISGFFHPFKINNLREMVSIMAILTAKGTWEVCLKVFVVLPWVFVVISPLGVLVPLILFAPSRLVLLGVVLVPSWYWVIIVSFFSFLFGIVRLMAWISCI